MIEWELMGSRPARRSWSYSESSSSVYQVGITNISTVRTTYNTSSFSTSYATNDLPSNTDSNTVNTTTTQSVESSATTGTTTVSEFITETWGSDLIPYTTTMPITGSIWTTSSSTRSADSGTTTTALTSSFAITATTTSFIYATSESTTHPYIITVMTSAETVSGDFEVTGMAYQADYGNMLIVFTAGTHALTDGTRAESTSASILIVGSTSYVTSSAGETETVTTSNNPGDSTVQTVSTITNSGILPAANPPSPYSFPTPTTASRTHFIETTTIHTTTSTAGTATGIAVWSTSDTTTTAGTVWGFASNIPAPVNAMMATATGTIGQTHATTLTSSTQTSTSSTSSDGVTTGFTFHASTLFSQEGQTIQSPLSCTDIITRPPFNNSVYPAAGSFLAAQSTSIGYYRNSVDFTSGGLAGALSGPCPPLVGLLESSVNPGRLGLLHPQTMLATSGTSKSTIEFGSDGNATSSWTETTSVTRPSGTDSTTTSVVTTETNSFPVSKMGTGESWIEYRNSSIIAGPATLIRNDGPILFQNSTSETLVDSAGPFSIATTYSDPVKLVPIPTVIGPCIIEVPKYQ